MPEETTDPPKPAKSEVSEAEIDMNLAQTFPASDPPSWTLGVDHRTKSEPAPSSELKALKRPSRG